MTIMMSPWHWMLWSDHIWIMEFIKRERETLKGKKADDKRIKLNIGGVLFESWASTLERIPGTRLALLAHLHEGDESWDKKHGEFFFDRHAGAFMSILHYYRTEELHVDQNICGNIIRGVSHFVFPILVPQTKTISWKLPVLEPWGSLSSHWVFQQPGDHNPFLPFQDGHRWF